MEEKHHKALTVITLIMFLIAASNFYLYSEVKKDYTQRMDQLESNIFKELAFNRQAMIEMINIERDFSARQRERLENETLNNFKSLQDYFDEETSALKLNLQSQLSDVMMETQDLSEQVGSLRTGSDFSAVIEEAIQAVVSVRTNAGQGSGVIFHPDGYVMTNQHVLQGASQVALIDSDSNVYRAELVGIAEDADLAVLKMISNRDFEFLQWEKDVQVGERVVALGNPLGLSFTATEGIISATSRQIDYSSVRYIQTDVPINPGNSGGPLINTEGSVVGITTVKLTGSEGLGFAIPAGVAEDVAEQALS